MGPIKTGELARILSDPVSSGRVPERSSDIRTLTTASGPVDVYSRDASFLVAVAGRYLVEIVRDRGTLMAISVMRRALDALSLRYETFGYLGVIEAEAQLLMPADVRNGMNALVKRFSPKLTAAAIVFERTGFQATAVRSLVTGVNLASRASHPTQVFSDVREGVSWLAPMTPGDLTASGLLQITQQLRQSLREPSAM